MTRQTRIGFFVGGTLIILASFIFIVGDMSLLFRKKGYDIFAEFETAAGLDKRAAVKMAGVGIGFVKDIRLNRMRARVTLAINAGAEIPRDSKATFSTLGLLGEKYVEILPGKAAEMCRPGDVLPGLKSLGFDQVGEVLGAVGDEVKDAVQAIKDTLGPETRALLNRTLDNLAAASSELKDVLARNQGGLDKTVRDAGATVEHLDKSVGAVSAAAEDALKLVKDIAAENREAVRTNLEKIKELIGKIEESIRLLNSSLEKIDRGEGTVGKLIHDPEMYSDAKKTLGEVGQTARMVSSIRPVLDIQAGYYPKSELLRSAFSAGLWFSPNVVLVAGLVRDPWKSATTFSLQGGYRFWDFVARAGFIESEFGLGLDYHAFAGRLVVGLEGFDFNRPSEPRLRFQSKVFPVKYLYLVAGADDFVRAVRREWFFGLGVGLR